MAVKGLWPARCHSASIRARSAAISRLRIATVGSPVAALMTPSARIVSGENSNRFGMTPRLAWESRARSEAVVP